MIEYLGHNFIPINYPRHSADNEMFKCTGCMLKVFEETCDKYYYYFNKQWHELKLTCNECIIKNIIE